LPFVAEALLALGQKHTTQKHTTQREDVKNENQ